ncbi:MAG: aldehyde dehydrogenase family protein [Phycisphaerales bacterium]|nr:MAG: aldehyde dehydrogenase family protein [Phycisphaerales bacterium]
MSQQATVGAASARQEEIFSKLSLDKHPWVKPPSEAGEGWVVSNNPATGEPIAAVRQMSEAEYEQAVGRAHETFKKWRMIPAPKRGEIVRQIAVELRKYKEPLGELVSLEMGKIRTEGLGEIQEAIDIADFAVGLSRQLYGLTMHSERPGHRMYEQWHPLGVVGIITAFNFPAAVWAWNAMIAAVCGDTMLWKPSHSTPLITIAVHEVCNKVMKDNGWEGVFELALGPGRTIGNKMLEDRRIPLVSFTGSCNMGRHVAGTVAKRFGSTILELGGNNAIIADETCDIHMLLPAVCFGAVGTTGQRCTSTRRLFVHKSIAAEVKQRLTRAYQGLMDRIGDPLDENTLVGPMVHEDAINDMMNAMEQIRQQGGKILHGGGRIDRPGYFVEPTLVEATHDMAIVQEETFAPILYVFEYENLDDAIEMHNSVVQGLSSAMFTLNVRHAEQFLSHGGSDCGIANINIGTSGAEIGGAFGGEKETGGGRESGSDAWKGYMRRQTNTINWSTELPLAQGVKFE